MTDLLDLLKYVVPSLIVFATAYYFFSGFINKYTEKEKESHQILLKTIKSLTEQEEKRERYKLLTEQHKNLMPARLQAYERLMLLLERISLPNLVMRLNQPGKSASQMQALFLRSIREEFDHNLSQQIYISPETWNTIKSAKEECIQKINLAASKLTEDAEGLALSQKLLELAAESNRISLASKMLKEEARKLF